MALDKSARVIRRANFGKYVCFGSLSDTQQQMVELNIKFESIAISQDLIWTVLTSIFDTETSRYRSAHGGEFRISQINPAVFGQDSFFYF